jgi:DNA-binding beta-propeller fold protein YncE
VTVSPDGANVYVASDYGDSVAVFDRAVNGTLTQKAGAVGCISADTSGGLCAFGKALRGPTLGRVERR